MNKEKIANHLKVMGFEIEVLDYCSAYLFTYEEMSILCPFDEDDSDDTFFRLLVPNIFDVTEDNRAMLLDYVNEINLRLKYTKTTIADKSVWVNYEHYCTGSDDLEEVIEQAIMALQATVYSFQHMVNGDDIPDDGNDLPENDSNNDEV